MKPTTYFSGLPMEGDAWDAVAIANHSDIPDDTKAQQAQSMIRACDSCKKLKRKCSGHQPCQQCVRKHTECVYSNPRKRGPKKVSPCKREREKRDGCAGFRARAFTRAPLPQGWAKRLKVQAEAAGLVLQEQRKEDGAEANKFRVIDWCVLWRSRPCVWSHNSHKHASVELTRHARCTRRKLINEYHTHLHPVMPICSNDEMCAALQKIRSADPTEVKPVQEARQAFVLGAQACGAFLIQDKERLPQLVNALHGPHPHGPHPRASCPPPRMSSVKAYETLARLS